MIHHAMPTPDILQLLIAERDKLDRAIAALQGRGRRGRPRGRQAGRPPKARAGGGGAIPSPFRKRRRMSAAARKAASARMKKYWAERKKMEKK